MRRLLLFMIGVCSFVSVQASNTLTLTTSDGAPGDTVLVSVALANSDAVSAAEIVVPVGEQLHYVPNSVVLSAARANGHQITASQSTGNLKIYIYSFGLQNLTGSEGEVCSFRLVLGTEPIAQDLTPVAVLSNSMGTELQATALQASLTILAPKIEITTPVLDYGHVAIRSTYTSSIQLRNSGTLPLTISEILFSAAEFCVQGLPVTIAAGTTSSVSLSYAPTVRGAVSEQATIISNAVNAQYDLAKFVNLTADPFSVNELHVGSASGIAGDTVTVELTMNNMESIVAGEVRFKVPSQVLPVANSFTLSERKTDHIASTIIRGDSLILMFYSPTNTPLTDNDGVIGSFKVVLDGATGTYYFDPKNIVLANTTVENMVSASSRGSVTITSPKISATSTLIFPSAYVTDTAFASVSVKNIGRAPLTIDRITFLMEGFECVTPLPLTIPQNQSEAITIMYLPSREGSYNTSMQIYSDDPTNRMHLVAVSSTIREPNTLALRGGRSTDTITLSVDLNNYSDVSALQFEISGLPTTGVSLIPSARMEQYSTILTPRGDGVYQVLAVSMTNTPVTGHEGEILKLQFLSTEAVTAEITSAVISTTEGVDKNTTSECRWTEFPIAFRNYDGTLLQSSLTGIGDMPEYKGAIPHKASTAQYSYVFAGWNSTILGDPSVDLRNGEWEELDADVSYTYYRSTNTGLANSYYQMQVKWQGVDHLDLLYRSYAESYYDYVVINGLDNAMFSSLPSYSTSGIFAHTRANSSTSYSTAYIDCDTGEHFVWICYRKDGSGDSFDDRGYVGVPKNSSIIPVYNIIPVSSEATYVARYDSVINKYLIAFKNYDQSILYTDSLEYGQMPVFEDVPVKPATAQYTYIFKGWDKEIISVVGVETYTAQFDSIINKYTITFADDDGTILQTSEVEYGQVPAYNGATPTKPASAQYTYAFAGWSPEVVAVTAAATYTATYSTTTNGYLIQFVNYDGATLQSGVVNYGVTPDYTGATPTKPTTAQYTYTFKGWNKEIVSVIGAETYTALFDSIVNKYTISFVDEDGTILQTSEVEYGQVPAYNGAIPSKPATAQYTYAFAGWTPEVVAVTGEATYSAQFNPTVNTYLVNGEYHEYGEEVTFTANVPECEHFVSWCDGNTDNPRTITVSGDFSVEPIFATNQYTITFRNDDGTVLQSGLVNCGDIPTYDGQMPYKETTAEHTYTFSGWNPAIVTAREDAVYTARFSSITNGYQIIFQDDNGATLQSSVVNYGVTPAYTGATPTKPATAQYTYTFKGWDKEIVSVVGVETYTAQFDSVVNKYTIIFVDEDGTVLQTSEVEYGQVPAYNGATPTKPSTGEFTYTFASWSPNVVAVTGNATYTATYTNATNSYLIQFVNYDGSTLQSGVVNYGVTPAYTGTTPIKPSTAQYTYTFTGWDKEIVSVVGAETYTAQFDSIVNKYTITFVDEDGSVLQTSEVEYGQVPAYNGATPSKAATGEFTYTFAGWSPNVVAVTGNATYTATYTNATNSYLIQFVNYDGSTLQSGVVNYGVTPAYTGAIPTKPSTAQYTYTFTGWDKEIVSVVGAETYTAQFDSIVNKYTITFVDEDGSVLQTSEVEYGRVPAYNGATPSKAATAQYTYVFAGWSHEVVAVTAAATYTATYSSTINSYLIQFVNYDGSTLQSGVVNYGVTPTYTGAAPTKPSTAQYTYTFKGWSPAIASVTDAVTYTAQFDSVVNKYSITFVDDDGTTLQTSEVEYGQVPAYNGATPSKAATSEFTYTFAGWEPQIVAVAGDATYTASYSSVVNQYTITVSGENCTITGDGTYDYGTEVTITVTPDEGYQFVAWSDGNTDSSRQITVTEDATYTAILEKIETGWEENVLKEKGKVIFDGHHYYILRDGKVYDAIGRKQE